MHYKWTILVFSLATVLCNLRVNAQSDSTAADSTSIGGVHVGGGSISISAGVNFGFDQPCIELSFGRASMISTDFRNPVQLMGQIGIAYGRLSGTKIKSSPLVQRADNDRLYVQLYSPTYLGAEDTTMTRLSGWRFGLHLSSGYSFMQDTSTPSFSLLHTGGPLWSFNSFEPARLAGGVDTIDQRTIEGLRSSHFGSHSGFSLRWSLSSAIALQADVERTMMFHSSSFFPWFGSVLLEGISQGILSGTILRSIEIKSPKSVPYAALILRSALSFAWYELRRSKQHFPFGGNRPMVSDAARIAVSISF